MKPHGYFFYTGPNGEQEQGMLFQCCHCGKMHEVRKGIEKKCGRCPKCMGGKHGGFICGPTCAECIPIEQRLENMEHGLPEETPRPVKVLIESQTERTFSNGRDEAIGSEDRDSQRIPGDGETATGGSPTTPEVSVSGSSGVEG
jgi:hypothetical protein